MSPKTLRVLFAAAALAAVAGCQTTPPPQRLPDMTFANLAPYRLDVGQLEVVSEYVQPARPPHVEHVMPVSPEQAARRWAQDRLAPVGRTGAVRFIIKDASVVEVPLRTDKGFTGLFKEQQEARFDASLVTTLQVIDERGYPAISIDARANRSRTVPEGTKLVERDRIWYDMVEQMMQDVNSQFDVLIPQYGGNYIR